MKIAVLGAGFTGLAASLRLLQMGHQVTLFEKNSQVGGLAAGFRQKGWDWPLDRAYHHCFINDYAILNLAKEIGQEMLKIRPETNIFIKGSILPIDSPSALLKFPYLPLTSRLRTGLVIGYLRYLSDLSHLENKAALPWLKKTMGKGATDLIWEPLFAGKFGKYKDEVSLTWFWGRIKKRSPVLCYPVGGFQTFAQKIAQKIEKLGGKILLNTEGLAIRQESKFIGIQTNIQPPRLDKFDKIIVTLPTPIFIKITSGLPQSYITRVSSIPHLWAQTLILVLKKPFLKTTYWLNINDTSFPFLILAEQTNFISPQYYGGEHILYIGNYLPDNHPYLKKSASELLEIFDLFLKRINPDYQLHTTHYRLFTLPFAQPVVDVNYLQKIPSFKTPLKNVYLANMDMVYPWDRETNYAVEMGEKIAELVNKEN